MKQTEKILPRKTWKEIVIKENNEPLVLLEETNRLIFGKNLSSYTDNDYRVRKTVAEKLYKASESLSEKYKLVVVEGARSLIRQQEHWNNKIKEFKTLHPEWSAEKVEYEARLVVAKPAPLANHNCGGAVDVALVDANDSLVDMGTFAQSSERSMTEMFSQLITAEQARNRKILREIMEKEGFVWYPGEWWHYCYGDRMWAVYTSRRECFYGPIESIC